jgi:hypothetical protein
VAVNSFKPKKYEDFEIVDGAGKAAGAIRVKPSGILWSPKGKHNWRGVDLASFAAFMEKNGKKQSK